MATARPARDYNDMDVLIHPGAAETCNGLDDDCNGTVDDAGGAADLDGDGIPETCDNCPGPQSPDQSDSHSDDEGDACDLDDGRPMVWVPGPARVDWGQEPTFYFYDVYRGDSDVLKMTGESTQDPATVPLAGRFCGLIDPLLLDAPPPQGKGLFYLVAVSTASGYVGIGNDSAGNPRLNAHPCP